jgi:hypothetical protein
MDEFISQALTPCRYHRLCQGYSDPARGAEGNLCSACLDSINEGYEQVELEEQADRLAAKDQEEAEQG